jgi:SSS family solute:Na+ symporter
MVAIGVLSRKRARTADGFFIANRSRSTTLITGSLVATIIGGSATVGLAGLGFTRGLTGMWWLLVGSIGLIVLGIFFAEKVRKTGVYTLPGLAEKQYDGRVSIIISVLIIISWIGVIAGQIVATGKIMGLLQIGSPELWMVIFTLVFISYTLIGGQYADIGTDMAQAILIFVGIFAGTVIVILNVGGFEGLFKALPAEHTTFPLSSQFGILDLISYLLLVGGVYVVGPDMYSRILSARDGKTARRSTLWAAFLIIPFAVCITFIGMSASVLFPGISPEQAFPVLMIQQFPPILGALVLAALISATMSSADSCVLSASTILTVDIVKKLKPELEEKQLLLIARIAVVVFGLLSLGLALFINGIISALLFAYTVYTGGVIIPILAGFYREKLKVTSMGAIFAIIGGGLAALISKLASIQYLDIGALLISLILLFLVSFIDRKLQARTAR